MVASFWMSHAVVGICEFESVFAHLLMFIKMQDQHGQSFAIKHERRLLDLCYNRTKASQEFDLDLLLSEPCTEIVHELQLSGLHNIKPIKQSSNPRPSAANLSASTANPAPSAASKIASPKVAAAKIVKKQICFNFDPLRNIHCHSLSSPEKMPLLCWELGVCIPTPPSTRSKGHF